jgi:hypothetical protein
MLFFVLCAMRASTTSNACICFSFGAGLPLAEALVGAAALVGFDLPEDDFTRNGKMMPRAVPEMQGLTWMEPICVSGELELRK